MTRRKKIAVIVAALCGCALVFSVAALTVARPLTAKVYHSIRSWYIEYSQKEELEALYDYQPESPERFDVTAVSLPTVQPLTAEEEALYQKTVLAVLQEDPWTPRDLYDAANYLIVPLHYAFYSRDQEKIDAFHQFFTRFSQDLNGADTYEYRADVARIGDALHFNYFVSEYLRLCAMSGQVTESLPVLYQEVYQDTVVMFEETMDGWTSLGSYRKRLEQVLLHREFPRSFDSALSGAELATVAALCNLRVVAKFMDYEDTQLLQDAALLGYLVYQDPEIITPTQKGGFLFQVGVWSDYPDMQYAGNREVTPDMQPNPRDDIVMDTNHFAMYIPWMLSFQLAQTYQEQYDLFTRRREELANQFVHYVIQYEDGAPLATTFMDGTCGVYRYDYHGDGIGEQGYSLSSSLLLGRWALLDDPRITEVYGDLLAQFPLSTGMENPYYDYATVREQNPFFDSDTAFDNGMMECITTVAYCLYAD